LYRFSPTKITGIQEGINPIDFKTEKGLEIAPYISYEKNWNKLSMSAGLRYSWFGNFGPFEVASYNPNLPKTVNTILETKSYKKGEIIKSYGAIEPRLSFNYHINDYNSLKFGYNRMFQYIHLVSNTSAALPFDIWKPSGMYIPPIEVNQISAGYAFDTANGNYNFSLEGYYKTFKNMVEYKNGADLFLNKNLETELLPAKGYSYGLEFAAYKTSGRLTGNLNYTYSVTRRKTTSSYARENINNGSYYPSNYDKPHIFNLTANYKLNKKWSVGSFFTYQAGRPTTAPNGRFTFNGNSYINYSNRNGFRISDTHRMDVSFTYSKNKPNRNWKGSWSFGVYNVYSNKNAFSVYSKFKNNQLKTYQFSVIGGAIPFITYNFKF